MDRCQVAGKDDEEYVSWGGLSYQMADLAYKVVVRGRKDSKHIPRPVHVVTSHRWTL